MSKEVALHIGLQQLVQGLHEDKRLAKRYNYKVVVWKLDHKAVIMSEGNTVGVSLAMALVPSSLPSLLI